MIREDRDPAFWRLIAEHPEVSEHVSLGREFDVAELVEHPAVTPLRGEHGGFLFVRLDGRGRVFELHTMFTPEGWGREALLSAKAAFDEMFARGAEVITTQEAANWWRSRPPKTFRFQAAGEFSDDPTLAVSLRTWVLTRAAWQSSPAKRSYACQQ